MNQPLRLAMWSGPRNISTAMMRAWENRRDCAVVDEPFYAHYLLETRSAHPGRDEVIRGGELDWRKVVASLLGPAPEGRAIFYQKHMTHHMLAHIKRDFMRQLTNVFLIRDPRDVLASYVKSRPTGEVTVADIGVPQQAALYDEVAHFSGEPPLLIDSGEFLKNPEAYLRALCAKLGVDFSDRMLHWPPGPRPTDGVWAPHWYDAVWRSSGFELPEERDRHVPDEHRALIDAAMPVYERLFAARLRP